MKNSKFAMESLRYRSYRPILIPIPIPIVSIPESMPQVFWTTLTTIATVAAIAIIIAVAVITAVAVVTTVAVITAVAVVTAGCAA